MTKEELSILTKKQLAQALKNAMLHKSFSHITISELVETCGINRKTFYYHFQDIFDLLKWALADDETELIQNMYSIGNFPKCIEYLMDYMEKNQHLIIRTYDSIGLIGLRNFFDIYFLNLTTKFIESSEETSGYKLDTEYKEFLIRFYASGIATTLLDWITKKSLSDREATKKNILRIMQTLEQNLKLF